MIKAFMFKNNKFYLYEEENDLNQPIFKWRKLLYKDMSNLQWFAETDMVTYSLLNEEHEFIGGMIIFEDPDQKYTKNISVDAIIQFFHIQKEYRGNGFGLLLLKKAIRKYSKIFLATDEKSSDVAKKMYKKSGFKIIEKKGNYIYWVKS